MWSSGILGYTEPFRDEIFPCLFSPYPGISALLTALLAAPVVLALKLLENDGVLTPNFYNFFFWLITISKSTEFLDSG
jgi:hypothetical protein